MPLEVTMVDGQGFKGNRVCLLAKGMSIVCCLSTFNSKRLMAELSHSPSLASVVVTSFSPNV